MTQYRLVSLDLDGTLFDSQSKITRDNLEEIGRITAGGVHAVIATGRPFCGLPFEQLKGSSISYAITTNGSSIYRIADKCCVYEDCIRDDVIFPILDYLFSKDIHFDVFINGDAYSPECCVGVGQKIAVPDHLRAYILNSRIRIKDMPEFIRSNRFRVQKITMNFYRDENGVLKDREEVRAHFTAHPDVNCVSGGYNNLELTAKTADKGTGLQKLADILGVPPEATIAIGDTENDLAILKAAGCGIAMGNATDAVKAASDDITLSNDESGVAAALRKYFPA